MTNQTDRFIDEVTEEVRRDRLFAVFKRFGWIGVLLILAIVAGTAWTEYSRAQARTQAQQWGDAVVAALKQPDPAAALAEIDALGSEGRAALGELLAAGEATAVGQSDMAMAELEHAAGRMAKDPVLNDLAMLKLAMLSGPAMDAARRDEILARLSEPGRPFRLLALEQKADALVGAGRFEDALTLIEQIENEDGVSDMMRQRLADMKMVLGVDPAPKGSEITPAPMN